MIRLENVCAGYDGRIQLRDVTLDICDNDFVGIVGPNGGGKTTLLRVIIGLIRPMSGTVRYYRNTVETDSLQIGYLPQYNTIDRDFPISVVDTVATGLNSRRHLFGGFSAQERQLALDALRQTGVDDLAKRSIKELSGGQLQRVLLARAIVSQPEVLILDEPNTYVDSRFERMMYEMIMEMNQKCTIIMVSHDNDFIKSSAKRIISVDERVEILR